MNQDKSKKNFTRKQKFGFTIIVVCFILFSLSGICELVLRFTAQQQEYSDKTTISSKFGWYPKSNYKSNYSIKNYGENATSYDVAYTTNENGFREWGKTKSELPKVLFLGDSYTQSVEVSNDSLFYNLIADSLRIEVFAFGQAGYGTLQEYLVLETFIEEINPDLIVLQTCSNDFIDNEPLMEYTSNYKVGLRRPYLNTQNKIIYQMPLPVWENIISKSKFLDLIRRKLENTFSVQESTQYLVTELGSEFPPYATSLEVTNLIAKKISAITNNTPVIAFSADHFEPYLGDMEKIFKQNKIPFDWKLTHEIERIQRNGRNLKSSDGYHWNNNGHKVVSELLLPIIKKQLY